VRQLQPPGWPQPKGYANGVEAEGKLIFVGGMIGWNEHGEFPTQELAGQVRQALENVVAVLEEAGATPENVARLTWYVTSADEYVEHQKEIGAAYRAVMGRHFPAMAVVEVSRLVEKQAKVEIEATAVL
jgi:enamine deaminase RidA (YjgF/YER057c/UK114 family)